MLLSERSALAMNGIKNWLKSTMSQDRLSHWILLSTHKESIDDINFKNVANVFCDGKEEIKHTFSIFCEIDFL